MLPGLPGADYPRLPGLLHLQRGAPRFERHHLRQAVNHPQACRQADDGDDENPGYDRPDGADLQPDAQKIQNPDQAAGTLFLNFIREEAIDPSMMRCYSIILRIIVGNVAYLPGDQGIREGRLAVSKCATRWSAGRHAPPEKDAPPKSVLPSTAFPRHPLPVGSNRERQAGNAGQIGGQGKYIFQVH